MNIRELLTGVFYLVKLYTQTQKDNNNKTKKIQKDMMIFVILFCVEVNESQAETLPPVPCSTVSAVSYCI